MKYILLFMAVAHAPLLPSLRVTLNSEMTGYRLDLIRCMWGAYARVLVTIIPDLLAPIVVPIALLFTKWEAESLPKFFWIWDNDVNINGDTRTDDPHDGLGGWGVRHVPYEANSQEAIDMCYYAPGHHPRSFYARWVWLGLRNRASALSLRLGKRVYGTANTVTKGDITVTRIENVWRYYELLKVGPVVIRMHCGYKIPTTPPLQRASVVSIGFSLRKAK